MRPAQRASIIYGTRQGEGMDVQRFLIGLGLLILVIGVLWPFLSRLGLGRLPGDIVVQREGFSFYFPLVTSLLLSLVLSLFLWLFSR
jgi:hypothetical protein